MRYFRELNFAQRGALKIAALYTGVSVLWILLSDRLLLLLLDDPTLIFRFSVIKGWVFVVLTGLLLFYLVGRLTNQLDEAYHRESALQAEGIRTLRLFECIWNNASEAVFAKDADGRYILANKKLAEYVGRPLSELIGKDDFELLSPEDAKEISALENSIRRDRVTLVTEEIIDTALGQRQFVTTKGPLLDESNHEIGIFGISHDISALKRSEAALRDTYAASEEQRALLKLFFDHVPAAVAMLDKDLNHLFGSRRWRDVYQVSEADMTGRHHYEVFPEIPPHWRAAHQRALSGETVRNDGECFERSDGRKLWVRWELLPWHDAKGDIGGVVILSEDLTAQHEAEEEIRTLNAELEQRVVERTAELDAANKELDAFAYAVSHDLRAPLRAMEGFATALEEDYAERLDGDARTYLDQIIIASRKMAELIEGILTLSRSTRGTIHREWVDVSALASERIAELRRLEPGRYVVAEVQQNISVRGDPRMVEVVLTNLIDNAWKYTSQTKSATIRVHALDIEDRPYICVEDNGAGFDMAYAERLFKPFQRLHRQNEFPGTGVGLATVKRIVQRHGGEIVAEGRPNEGAKFTFTLVPTEDPVLGEVVCQ